MVGVGVIRFTIFGEAASKANSRKLVKFGDRPASIKSDKARKYEKDALAQIPPLARQRLSVPCRITIRIFYASQRPDLDESVILDCLQDRWKRDKQTRERILVQKGVVQNDRQFREKHIFHAIDRANPRAEIEIEPLAPVIGELPLHVEQPRMRKASVPSGVPF